MKELPFTTPYNMEELNSLGRVLQEGNSVWPPIKSKLKNYKQSDVDDQIGFLDKLKQLYNEVFKRKRHP